MQLVNLKPNKTCKTFMQKQLRYFKKHSKMFGGCQNVSSVVPTKFDDIFKPYKPCGEEYVPDDMTNFTGVYVGNYFTNEFVNKLTNTTVLESLVDYGNVDNASQAIRSFADFCNCYGDRYADGNYVIFLSPIRRDKVYSWEESMGTYRWHKNGGYQGEANVCCEYFAEEPDEKLKLVYQYQVCKVV